MTDQHAHSSDGSDNQRAHVWRLARRIGFFSLLFVLYGGVVILVDPFNFITRSSIVSDQVKLRTSAKLNAQVWGMNEYRSRPNPRILLGDSRMGNIRVSTIEEVTGQHFYNFSYPGASVSEMADTFWFATQCVPLKDVYIGVNFVNYGVNAQRQRTKVYPAMVSNPLLYFVNHTVVQSTFLAAASHVTGTDPQIGRPRMDPGAFWRSQLKDVGWTLRNYRYPEESTEELSRIAAYCRAHGIRLHFIIFPTHVDVQRRIHELGLDEYSARFKRDLAKLGPTFDYDFEGPLTVDAANFKDPLHFGPAVADLLVREIFAGRIVFGKELVPSDQ